MSPASVIIISVLALAGQALAGCGSGNAGRLLGSPIRFPDIVLSPNPYPQHVAFHDRCQNTNPATGLLVKACSTYGSPSVLVTDVENAEITCPYGCVVLANDYCLYGGAPSLSTRRRVHATRYDWEEMLKKCKKGLTC